MKNCKVENCLGKYHALGYCKKHYNRYKKYGDISIVMGKTHGMSKTLIYYRWKTIKRRTTKPMATGYKNYGGRGIVMFKDWFESFEKFYAYLGDPPDNNKKYTIERIDNEKGYFPGNIKWASYRDQLLNRRFIKNKYGYPGAYQTRGFFYSQISVNGKRIYLGSFSNPELASKAFLEARKKYGKI